MLKFIKECKYVFLYPLLTISFIIFSRAYQINMYGTVANSFSTFWLCLLVWVFSLVVGLLYMYILLRIFKVKIRIRDIHHHFVWIYILGTCLNLVLYKFEYREAISFILKILFTIYELTVLNTKYNMTTKKCIIYFVINVITKFFL